MSKLQKKIHGSITHLGETTLINGISYSKQLDYETKVSFNLLIKCKRAKELYEAIDKLCHTKLEKARLKKEDRYGKLL